MNPIPNDARKAAMAFCAANEMRGYVSPLAVAFADYAAEAVKAATADMRRFLAAARPYIESDIETLSSEVDREFAATKAQRAIGESISKARSLLYQINEALGEPQ